MDEKGSKNTKKNFLCNLWMLLTKSIIDISIQNPIKAPPKFSSECSKME
jgi:hypothetical protein